MFNFEKLEVWRKSVHFADGVYSQIYEMAEEQARMLSGLRSSLLTPSS